MQKINGNDRFDSTGNLKNAINKADILFASINPKTQSFEVIVFDTYDFNPYENWIIKISRNAQEAKIIRSLYYCR